jgi:hypothetical protein
VSSIDKIKDNEIYMTNGTAFNKINITTAILWSAAAAVLTQQQQQMLFLRI